MLGAVMGLGSRLSVVSIAILIAVLTSDCGKPCEGVDCNTGGGGEAGQGGSGGDGGAGGETTAGDGGSGAEGGQGGAGGSETGGGGSGGVGGQGGAGGAGGGPCVPTFACGPKDCGIVDDGCGTMLNCDDPGPGDPITCASHQANQWTDGPMTCGEDHLCHCPAEGDTAAAMAKCGAESDNPGVPAWCEENGGCHTAFCGTPPVAKVPPNCLYGGGLSDELQIWCCIDPS